MPQTDNTYTTRGTVNAALYEKIEAKEFLVLPRKSKIIFAAYQIFCFVMAVVLFSLGLLIEADRVFYITMGIILMGTIVLFRFRRSNMNEKAKETSLARFKENVPSGEIEIETSFDEDGVHVRRIGVTGLEEAVIEYSSIARFGYVCDGENGRKIYMGTSKAASSFFVFASSLSPEEENALVTLINETAHLK